MTKNLKTKYNNFQEALNSGTKATVIQVQCLKDSLVKEHGKIHHEDFDPQRCLDLFATLDSLPVNLEVLSETLIGTIVSKFKSVSSKDDKVSSSAKALIKKWKALAKNQLPSPAVPESEKTTPPTVPSVSSNSPADQPEPWSDLAPYRRNICIKLSEVITDSTMQLEPNQVPTTVSAVEAAMHEYSRGDKQRYGEKARQLNFNLKKNADLRHLVLSGGVNPKQLCAMSSEELCSSDLAKQRQEEVNRLQESRRLDWEQANEDKINEMCGIKGDLLNASLFTCHRCKSTKTTSTQKQTRSADEPMTVFVLCTNCGNRWKC